MTESQKITLYAGYKAFKQYITTNLDKSKERLESKKDTENEFLKADKYKISILESCKENEVCFNAICSIFVDAFCAGYDNQAVIDDMKDELKSKLKS